MPALIHKQNMVGITPNIEDIGNVNINNPQNGEGMVYNATTQEWENKPIGGSESDNDFISLYGRTDISSRSDLHIRTVGNYYYNGSVYNKFSDLPDDIDSARYNWLSLTVRTLAKNTPYTCVQNLTVLNVSDAIIKQYIRYVYENVLSGDIVYGDWLKYSYGEEEAIEITSSKPDLNTYTEPGNYYKVDTSFVALNSPFSNATSMFKLRVGKTADDLFSQEIYDTNSTTRASSRYYLFNDATEQWEFGIWMTPLYRNNYLDAMASVTFTDGAIGQVMKFSTSRGAIVNSYLSDCAYDSSNSLSDVIGNVETLLASL